MMRIKYARRGLASAVILVAVPMPRATAAQAAAPPQKISSAKKAVDPFLTGPPFTFEQTLRLVRQNTISLRRRKDAIQRRGMAFLLSPEGIDKLRAAGAPLELLDAIKSKAISASASCPISAPPPPAPPSPPPPKRPPEGKLAIRCAPAECQISLNETARGSTHDGLLELAELPVGQSKITFKKNGYMDRNAVVTVEPDETVSISEILSPNRATQEAFGAELFEKVVKAVGLSETNGEQSAIEAAGTTTTWTFEGRSVRWMIWMRNQPERALFQIRAGRGLHEVSFLGSQYTTSKRMKAQDVLQLATDAGLIRDNQLSGLVARIRGPHFKMLANRNSAVPGEEFSLVAEGGAEKISLTLDDDLLPEQIQVETANGVGSRTVSYTDYSRLEGISYPKTMHIKPEGSRNGIDVHFDVVRINSRVSTSDYRLKRKPILDIKSLNAGFTPESR